MHKKKLSTGLLALLITSWLLAACATATPQVNPTLPAQPASTQSPAALPTSEPASPPTSLPAAAPAAVSTRAPTQEQSSGMVEMTDSRGQKINLNGPAQRIVSLAPSNTEILFAIGAGSQVVARDTYSDYPEEAKALTDIGGGFSTLNLEGILAARPDLVLASSLTEAEQIKAIEDAGLKVFALANPTDFDGLYANLETVAQLTGHEKEAATLVDSLKQRVSAVETRLGNVTQRPLVFYELDGTDPNAPWTPGPGTFIDTLIKMSGGENLGASLNSDWVQINLEEIIARKPDIILLGDATWGGVTVEAAKARAGWDAISAVKSGQIFPFDDNTVSRPGPRLVDGLEAMALLLHPELFK
jgi:iron complex transport system substrate-binding protein